MRKLILMVGLIVTAAGCSDAGAQSVDCISDCSRMQYVGNSTNAFLGSEGIYVYYAACQTDFGPGHRMCTSDEIWFTVDLPNLGVGQAWAGDGCVGWSGSGTSQNPLSGPAVDERGRTTSWPCSGSLSVACCGPR
jgi:hypothetical protein